MSDLDFIGLKIVIVNWCSPGDTIDCVHSLLQANIPINHVLVIDNGSTDDSTDRISKAFPGIDIQRLIANQGFAGGYNFGIELALQSGADKILILNNDTIVGPDMVQILMVSKWDVCVPKIYYYDNPGVIWSAGAQWRRFPPMVIMRGYQKRDNSRYDRAIELNYATACALLVRREIFEQVGMFDPQYESYFEDYDFMYRVHETGFRIGYVPEAKVWHKVSQSLGENSPQRLWYLGRNSILFYRKDKRFSSWALYCFLLWVAIREILKLNFRQLFYFWRGILDGFKWLKYGTRRM
jgi:GT2 family glycosyltransferase